MHTATGSMRFSLAIQRIGWNGPVDQVTSFDQKTGSGPPSPANTRKTRKVMAYCLAKRTDFANQFVRTTKSRISVTRATLDSSDSSGWSKSSPSVEN